MPCWKPHCLLSHFNAELLLCLIMSEIMSTLILFYLLPSPEYMSGTLFVSGMMKSPSCSNSISFHVYPLYRHVDPLYWCWDSIKLGSRSKESSLWLTWFVLKVWGSGFVSYLETRVLDGYIFRGLSACFCMSKIPGLVPVRIVLNWSRCWGKNLAWIKLKTVGFQAVLQKWPSDKALHADVVVV